MPDRRNRMSNFHKACSLGYTYLDNTGYYVYNGEDIFHRFTNKQGDAIFIGPVNTVISEADVRADAVNYEWVTV